MYYHKTPFGEWLRDANIAISHITDEHLASDRRLFGLSGNEIISNLSSYESLL